MKKEKKNDAQPPEVDFGFSIPIGTKFEIDRDGGRLKGLQILTGDREALGHGIYLDQRTVDTAAEAVGRQGGRMRGAITHGSIIGFLKNGGDRILEVPGFFSEVKAVGNQLVGDFEFFESFRTEEQKAYTRLIEMAEKTPDLIGLSAEPAGYLVYVAEDGTEHTARYNRETGQVDGAPEGVALRYGGMPAMRITRLRVAAFVDDPAATDGLFAKLSRMFTGGRSEELNTLRGIAQAVLSWAEKQPAWTGAATGVESSQDAKPTSTDHDMSLFAAIKAKFGSDKKKHTRALELASEDPSQPIDTIVSKLAAEEAPPADPAVALLGAIKTRFGADKDLHKRALGVLAEHDDFTVDQIAAELAKQDQEELVKLRKTAADEKARADKAEADYAKLKNSGHPGALNLGTAGGAGGGTQETEKKEPTGLNRVAAAFSAQLATSRPGNN